ncbi:MAG: glycosyl hydrolase family 3 [Muribaculum sp.]|nr:glycosyl hydrolase family 3 [Muribaculum sp.]
MTIVVALQGCGVKQKEKGMATDSVAMPSALLTDSLRAEQWADSVMRTMSLQLRVGQLFMPAVYTRSDEATLDQIRDYVDRQGVGGIVLLKGDVVSAALIADSLSTLAHCGLFIAIDAEKGLSMRLSDAPGFLWNSQISSEADADDLYEYGREVARESRLAGINMILGPVMDVSTEGRSIRSFGMDPRRVAELGVAYSRGLEAGGVVSVAKHFPGHGSARGDSHDGLVTVGKSKQEMWTEDLLPFRQYCKSGLSGVMVGHIYASALDTVRRPAAFSPVIMKGLLRQGMGFQGLIITDAINMGGAAGYSAVDALESGADIVLAPARTEREIAGVVEAVESGRLPESIINDRCRRVLVYKYLYGLNPEGNHHLRPTRGNEDALIDTLHKGAVKVKPRLVSEAFLGRSNCSSPRATR